MHRSLLASDQPPRYAELHALRVPALFVAEANEPARTLELMLEWHWQVPGSELAILRDCYHAAHRENDAARNSVVQSFLSRHAV